MAAINPMARISGSRLIYMALAIAVLGAYIFSTSRVKALPRQMAIEQINVAISPAVQIVLAIGDKYLASNLATFRASVVSVEIIDPADYRILAKVQDDASMLNPAQADNYYFAQGILPWIGEHRPTIAILERATIAKPRDFLPPYFLGFDYMYFESRFDESGRYYKIAADRVEGKNRDALLNRAGKFMEKGNDPVTAIQFINGLIRSTRDEGLKQFLQSRIVRLEGLIDLRDAATRYEQQHQKPPGRLEDLVKGGFLKEIPADPFGTGYRLDDEGVPQIIFHIKRLGEK